MAAFQFPATPFDLQTVENPITGSTYQWRSEFTKWVLTRQAAGGTTADLIWEGDQPPYPINDYKLWYSTDTLELYFHFCDANGVCAWVPTSAPITMLEDLEADVQLALAKAGVAEAAANANVNTIAILDQALAEVENSLGKVTLEEVLTNGNVADKDIYLTHIASSDSDIIDISPEKAKVVIATEGSKVPTFELQHYAVDDNSQVKLELDEDGTRFDIECDEKVNNIHFRFEDDVKFELNKTGDALFTGGLDVNGIVSSNGIANQGNALFKFGSGQGLVLDSGSSFEPMLELKSYSGPGERKEVFSVNARGNASLLGKLTLAPGESDNQAATYGQLATLAEQIEQINPTYERGKYTFSQTEVTGSNETRGTYNLVRKNNSNDSAADRQACQDALNVCNRIPDADPIDCQREYDSCLANIPANGTIDTYIDKFSEVKQIKFSKYDADGAKHEWTDVAVGQLVDIFNDDNDDYFVGTITAIDNGTSVVTLDVDKVQAKGKATGKARIKVFTLNNEIDELTNYVRKTGDTMTGKLEINSTVPAGLIVKGNTDSDNSVFYVQDSSSQTKFRVRGNGQVQAGLDASRAFIASEDHDIITKKYLDDALAAFSGLEPAPAQLAWKFDDSDSTSGPAEGYFKRDKSGIWRFSFKTYNGIDLGYNLVNIADPHSRDTDMTVWYKKEGKSWRMKAHYHIRKWRWNYTSGGVTHFEMHQAAGYGTAPSNGTIYYVKLGGWF